MQIQRKKNWLIYITILLLPLAGCSKTIVSEVTRFHHLPPANQDTIEVVSMDKRLQNSLEFGQYAELIGKNLGKVGYSPPNGLNSRLIARIAYSSQSVNSILDNSPKSSVSIGASSGGRRSGLGVGISIPFGKSEPQQDYIYTLFMEIIRRSNGEKLYEGRATSQGREGLPVMMPYLVEALFRDFPGATGTSQKVKVSP